MILCAFFRSLHSQYNLASFSFIVIGNINHDLKLSVKMLEFVPQRQEWRQQPSPYSGWRWGWSGTLWSSAASAELLAWSSDSRFSSSVKCSSSTESSWPRWWTLLSVLLRRSSASSVYGSASPSLSFSSTGSPVSLFSCLASSGNTSEERSTRFQTLGSGKESFSSQLGSLVESSVLWPVVVSTSAPSPCSHCSSGEPDCPRHHHDLPQGVWEGFHSHFDCPNGSQHLCRWSHQLLCIHLSVPSPNHGTC